LKKINAGGKIHMVPATAKDIYFIRMAVCSRFSQPSDMELAWREVSTLASSIQEL
jgi:aromatic-L-amino-acid/L-tryptophan decarboxylase